MSSGDINASIRRQAAGSFTVDAATPDPVHAAANRMIRRAAGRSTPEELAEDQANADAEQAAADLAAAAAAASMPAMDSGLGPRGDAPDTRTDSQKVTDQIRYAVRGYYLNERGEAVPHPPRA